MNNLAYANQSEIFDDTNEDLSCIFPISKPEIKYNEEKKELSSSDFPYSLSIYQKDFAEEKDLIKYVKSCERMIRCSPEYKIWVNYLREVMGKYSCALTKEVNSETSVEIHHHPFSLYDIVGAVISRFISSGKEFCSFDIIKDVLELHYQNKIGYIPLISSIHEKYHNGCLDIPIELVSGNWKEFKISYSSFISDDDLNKITNRIDINFNNCNWNSYKWSNDNYIAGQEN